MIDTSEGDDAHRRRLRAHLDAMLALCETVDCRRARLLDYFGQQGAACGNCDTCLSPPESWDGTVPAQKVMSTVVRLLRERRQKFGTGQIIDILLGRKTPKVLQFQHDALSVFGIGTELGEAEWRGVVRQLLAQGLLGVEGDYGTLVLTDAGAELLSRRGEVRLRREPRRAERTAKTGATKTGAAKTGATKSGRTVALDLSEEATAVFEHLRSWRAAKAKELGVPAYVIFHDATLREIATSLPASMEALAEVSGVGENKLAKYGEELLAALVT
jgi:ATP-dependent DNA helicase RecQ